MGLLEAADPARQLALPARIVAATAAGTAQALRSAMPVADGADGITVDARALLEFDSSAVAVLLDLARALKESGTCMTLVNLSPRLADLIELYGVAGILPDGGEVAATSASAVA